MKWLPVQSEYGRAHRHGRAGVVGGALTKQSAARVAPCPRSPPRRRRPRSRPTSACRPGSRRARPCCTSRFGEAGLPVLPSVAERLGAAAGANGYGPVAGSPGGARGGRRVLRAARAADRAPSDPPRARQQGAALRAAHRAAGRRRAAAPVVGELRRAGGAGRQARDRRPDRRSRPAASPTPRRCARRSARRGRHGAGRRSSSSPCPTTRPARWRRRRSSRRSATSPREHGLLIVCDEIYRDLAYDPEAFVQPRRRCCPSARSSPTG